jgi:tetratricopeptide (TPR) repeat protein
MGFVARKSFKVAPGVRMTVSKSGVSASVGGRGARVSASTSGRVTRTVGVPGTGVRYTKASTLGSGRNRPGTGRSAASAVAPASPPRPSKPGWTAPKWEKALYKVVRDQDWGSLEHVAKEQPDAMVIAVPLDGLMSFARQPDGRALQLLRWAWENAGEIGTHPFVQKYLSGSTVTIPVAHGVEVTLPLNRDAVGLALAELEQQVVEHLEPSTYAAVSLCDLYLEVGRYDDVVDITNGIPNTDDPTALLAAFRGVALRELGHQTASREALKEALKSKSRDETIRHFALVERAKTYVAENKRAMARKDLERVLAENSNYEGVREMLTALE